MTSINLTSNSCPNKAGQGFGNTQKAIGLALKMHPTTHEIIQKAAKIACSELDDFVILAAWEKARNTLGQEPPTDDIPAWLL